MTSSSLYNSATGVQAPHCLHAIGIGRTGAAHIEALIRTGEIEDLLAAPGASPREPGSDPAVYLAATTMISTL